MLPIFGNSQVINGKTYTPFNNFYKWRGGAFDTTLLMPQVASANGKRAGAIYYNISDSTVYTWTGTQWRKIGGASENNYTELIGGGKLSRNATLNRFTIGSATYYIQGQYYTSPFTQLNGFAKTPNINGRIDIVALGTTGPVIIQGTESPSPVSPTIAANSIKIGFVYYPPFDSLPALSGNGIEAIFRKPGADSIFFSTSDTTLSIKDSIGISVATNGLTATNKTIKLGGNLTENTTIKGSNTRSLTIDSLSSFLLRTDNNTQGYKLWHKNVSFFGTNPSINQTYITTPLSSTISIGLTGTSLELSRALTNSITLQSDTAQILGRMSYALDPSSGFTRFSLVHKQYVDNIASNKLNISDTAAMLSNYLRSNVTAATLDFPSTSNNAHSDLTVTVTGATAGDVVSIGVPNVAVNDHSCYTAWVSADNQVTIRFNNYGGGAHDPASGTFKVKVFK